MLSHFERLCTLPDADIDLGEAALLVATEAYPALDIDEYRVRLDALADGMRPWTDAAPDGPQRVAVLCNRLLRHGGFKGDREDYYDPRNSYLNDVLDRRLGIPISLAVLLIEVGRRVGVDLHGVGFPGHFLVRHGQEQPIFIDAFHEGTFLDHQACRRLLEQVSQGRITFHERLLEPVPKRRIVVRMLRNLKAIHIRRRDAPSALRTCTRLLAIEPTERTELRDRGMLHYEAGNWQAAVDDLVSYTTEVGDGPDALLVRASLSLAMDKLESEPS